MKATKKVTSKMACGGSMQKKAMGGKVVPKKAMGGKMGKKSC